MNRKILHTMLCLSGLFLLSCEKDSSTAARNTVFQNSSNILEEVSMLINLKTNDSSYVVVNKIDSVFIKVGELFEVKTSSTTIDTANFNTYLDGDFRVTNKKLNYLVIARPSLEPQDFNTAGEYADYLNKLLELKAGEYVCLIESIWVTLNNGNKQQYFPHIYSNFTVNQDAVSAFAGEITIEI